MGNNPHKRRIKLAILEQAGRERLRELVDALELEGADRRSPAAMIAALSRARRATPERLLPLLREREVKAVCEACDLSSTGRKRALVTRLLGSEERPAEPALLAPARLDPFVAIDFETADYGRDSACAVALVRVEGGRVRERVHRLIRPPRRDFCFTHIHRITWSMVTAEPDFGGVWAEIAPLLEDAAFLAAHNASFDRSVLRACCSAAGLPMTGLPFLCTVKLARATWDLRPTKLPDVCRHLGLDLDHHDAASDAHACANIVLAAEPHQVAGQLGADRRHDRRGGVPT